MAYGNFQVRGRIRAVAFGLRHSHSNSNPDPSHVCSLHHSYGNAGSLTYWVSPGITPVSSWILVGFGNHWAMTGTPGNDFFFFFFFWLFRAALVAYGGSQVRGSNQSYSCHSTPQPQPRQIGAASAMYRAVHGNTRSLTRWARPGIKPSTSWFLVGSDSTVPCRNSLKLIFKI